MDALIVTAAGAGLAIAMLLVPAVAVATVTLAALCLFVGTSVAVLACVVGVPAAERGPDMVTQVIRRCLGKDLT